MGLEQVRTKKRFPETASKFYENYCLQNFLLDFMSLLTVKFVKSSHLYARIYFIFLKNVLSKPEILLIPNFDLTKKIRKAVIN